VRDLTVTLVQPELCWQDPAANRALLASMLRGLESAADLIVLPEMFATGFTMDAAANAETMNGESVRWLRGMAAELGTTLCGSLIIEDTGRYHNRLVWMPPGGTETVYDKRHLFRMAGEHEHYCAGRRRKIVQLGDWRVCPLICYDLRFPVFSRGVDEYDLLIYVANWPGARRSAWQVLLPARAVENLCYVVGVNRVGTDGNQITYAGDSTAVDYLGHALTDCGSSAGTATVTLDGAALARYRGKFPAWRDADRFRLED